MKNTIIIAALCAVIVSCKKKTETNEFTQTDVTGTSVVKGNVNKNVITPNGSGGYLNTARIPAKGVNVSIKVNKNSLYPNSNASGADVYTGTTDDNGNYAITIRSNATGVSAQITVDGFTGTQDTIVNGNTRTGLLTSYTGTTTTRTVFMGQNSQFDYSFTANNVSSNPNTVLKTGTATVTGSVGVSYIKDLNPGSTTTVVPLQNHKVYLNLSNDPNTLMTKMYETTTDSKGYYTFNVNTVAAGTAGFNQNVLVYITDFAATRDTIKANNTIKTGPAGVFQQQNINIFGVFNNSIKNANHLTYNVFVQD